MFIKAIRICLLILIIIGVGLILTQSIWVPNIVDKIIQSQNTQASNIEFSNTAIQFIYPDSYKTSEGSSLLGILLIPKNYVPPTDGEGPPEILINVWPNTKGMALEEWVKNNGISTYTLSDHTLTNTAVAGESALMYGHHSGSYETDTIVVIHSDKVYVFSDGWVTSQGYIHTDFQNLLKTVSFK